MTGSLAGLVGVQAVRIVNVVGGETMGGRGALLHVRGTSLSLMMIKGGGGGADVLHVRGVTLGEMTTLHGRVNAMGVDERGCCQGFTLSGLLMASLTCLVCVLHNLRYTWGDPVLDPHFPGLCNSLSLALHFHVVAEPPHCPKTITTRMELVWTCVIVIAHTCVEGCTCHIVMVCWTTENSLGGVGWRVGLLPLCARV